MNDRQSDPTEETQYDIDGELYTPGEELVTFEGESIRKDKLNSDGISFILKIGGVIQTVGLDGGLYE